MSSKPKAQYSWVVNGPLALLPTPLFQTGAIDQFTKVASGMALVHNSVIRGLNSIYLQAPRVQPHDYENFIGYSLAWYELLNAHHDGEEDFLFPRIEAQVGETGLMDANVKQHGREYKFAGQTLVDRMDSFKDVLIEHLTDEIPTILNLAQYGDRLDMLKLMDEDGKRAMCSLSKFHGLRLFFCNDDVTYENGMHAAFPPAPKIAKLVIMHLFTYWNPGYWKFATFDKWGMPKELHYAGPK
ncbi:hypothetical protein BU16DRAFT_537769 [Lophium mytilinum]|uniref:Hemerythrin-like domain-containing protein n=1 Tax=Lophium mytilinum TaxID=390894 RepID=A0A6A6QWS4_9PEZI|nr:hypothetical protein BU16DRAFT_537769 [Lophium mytilinum]